MDSLSPAPGAETAHPGPGGGGILCPTCLQPMPATSAPDWLVPAAQRVPSPHRYLAGHPRVKPLDLVVLHYTASPWQEPAAEEARVRRWLAGAGRESSTHFVILRTGEVIQGVPLTERAWHVVDNFPHEGRPINYRSVAIDFANVGFLTRKGAGIVDYYGGAYRGPAPYVDARGWLWEPVTPEQVAAASRLLAQLGEAFPALRAPGRLIGHSDVQPTRSDPGPTVPRAELDRALMGIEVDA